MGTRSLTALLSGVVGTAVVVVGAVVVVVVLVVEVVVVVGVVDGMVGVVVVVVVVVGTGPQTILMDSTIKHSSLRTRYSQSASEVSVPLHLKSLGNTGSSSVRSFNSVSLTSLI